MDEVKAIFAEDPRLSEVIDLKVEVWRNQRRLCGAEIGTKYLVLSGMALCHFVACYTNLGRWILVREVTVCLSATWCLKCKQVREPDMAQIPVPVPKSSTRYMESIGQ